MVTLWWRRNYNDFFFNEFSFLLDPLTRFGEKKLYLGGCTNSKNQLCMPLHSKVMMDNVSTCRIFSQCLLCILIYSLVLIFTTVSPNIWSTSPFFCPWQQHFDKCTYINSFLKLGHILYAAQKSIHKRLLSAGRLGGTTHSHECIQFLRTN